MAFSTFAKYSCENIRESEKEKKHSLSGTFHVRYQPTDEFDYTTGIDTTEGEMRNPP